MKTTLFVLLISSFLSFSAVAEDKVKTDPKMDPKMEKMMEEWKKFATPGEGHKVLDGMVGNWKYKSKFWHTPESTTPEENKGTSQIAWILGNRYLEHKTKGKAMGQKFEGRGFVAYDNIKQKYETIWMDNFGTGVMHGTGEFDKETNTLKDEGEMSCPGTPRKKADFRGEWKLVDKKTMVFSLYGPPMGGGKEYKQLEMTYTR